jgi:hypothetical protein
LKAYLDVFRLFLPDPKGQHLVLDFMSSLRKASDNLDLYTTLASISGILIFLNITHKYPFSFDLMHRICSHPFHNAHLEELGLSAENGIGIKFSFVHLKYISIASVFTH